MTAPRRMSLVTKLAFALVVVVLAWVFIPRVAQSYNPGLEQPVPFSHRVHTTDKQLNCFFCHTYAAKSSNPGMPSVEKCMLCHKVVASNFEPVAKLRGYYGRKEPVPWARVSTLPDFVHFSHQAHVSKGHDCSECHGDVKSMDRIKPVHTIDMNFCVTCHKNNKASVDCYICHY